MRKIAAHYLLLPRSPFLIKQGYVVINDLGVICETGQLSSECARTEFYEGILCPGFVNAHTHTELSHLTGRFTPGGGQSDFIRQINTLRHTVGESERRTAIAQAFTNMKQEGIVAIGDISNSTESFAAKQQTTLYSRSFIEVYAQEAGKAAEALNKGMLVLQQAREEGLNAGISPHALYSMSPELLEQACREADKSGFLSIHNQESWEEEALFAFGEGPMATLFRERDTPFPPQRVPYSPAVLSARLHKNTHTLFVHNTFTNSVTYDLLTAAAPQCSWVLCPKSNLFINNALPPVELLRHKNARMAIGTDSLASNQGLSILEELKTLSRFFPHIGLPEMLSWATINGAEALGFEQQTGTLEAGKKPGLNLLSNIDWRNMRLTPETTVRPLIP